MTQIVPQETWAKLTRPTGDKLVARLALSEITSRLFCAIDANGSRHLLITLTDTDDEYNDSQSRGFVVNTKELSIRGNKPERYLAIKCLDAGGHAILDLMGGDLASGLADQNKQPTETVRRVLTKWRRFFGQIPQPILSINEQLGLFAELWFLAVWMIPKLGPGATMNWKGPWGSRHDFEWKNKSVEVKATTNTRGRIHRIHGIDQLEPPESGPLFLFSVRMREEVGAVNNLPKIIDVCRKALSDSDDAIIYFENALAQAGYSPAFEDEYSKLALRIIDDALYSVNDDFPKITRESFSNSLPVGVERLEYEINLNSFENLKVASKPDGLPFS